jgi:hypothetical protein
MERPAGSQKVIDEFTRLIDSQDKEIIRLKAELHVLKCKSWFNVHQENIKLYKENEGLKELLSKNNISF